MQSLPLMPHLCLHCNTPLTRSQESSGYCCAGCAFVHQLIEEEGLDNFYNLQGKDVGIPLNDTPFVHKDFSWLSDYQDSHPKGIITWQGYIQGVSCIGCVWLIEKLFTRYKGAISCDIFSATGAITLSWDSSLFSIEDFAKELLRFGYTLGKEAKNLQKNNHSQLAIRIGLCGAFALNAMAFSLPRYLSMPKDFLFAGLFELIVLISATLSLLVGGSWFFSRAWLGLREKILHMDTPISLGVLLAYLGSLLGWMLGYEDLLYFDFVSIFIFLMLAGRWLQYNALEKNRHQILEDTPLAKEIWSVEEKKSIPLDAICQDLLYTLPTGIPLPVNSRIESGSADFSLQWIHGEPDPQHGTIGSYLPAGAICLTPSNTTKPLLLRAQEEWKDSLLGELIAERKPSENAPLLSKILRWYLLLVFSIGFLSGISWFFYSGDASKALQVTLSIFVVSCPCALGLALPFADELANHAMRKKGVFIRSPHFWGKLNHIKTLFFDKTGTLTLDIPTLCNPQVIDTLSLHQKALLSKLAYASPHPLSRSLSKALGLNGQKALHTLTHTGEISHFSGLGTVLSMPNNMRYSLGKCGWDGQSHAPIKASHGGCELRENGILLARFSFQESLRDASKYALFHLKDFAMHILSGDKESNVLSIAKTLDIPLKNVHASLSAEHKALLVEQIDPKTSLFLGDGGNDSLAFDKALLSGAVAGVGVLEKKADFYFLSPSLAFLPFLFALGKKHKKAIKSSFLFSACYNGIAISLCIMGMMNPLLAAILMPISAIISLFFVRIFLW